MKKAFLIIGWIIGISLILLLLFPVFNAGHSTPKWKLEISALEAALELYKDEFDQYPQGNSFEIGQQLLGVNPKNTVYFDNDDSNEGFILDPWGRPYRFEYHEGTPMISSFGEDYRDSKDDKTNR